jgi:hypothetical protein
MTLLEAFFEICLETCLFPVPLSEEVWSIVLCDRLLIGGVLPFTEENIDGSE